MAPQSCLAQLLSARLVAAAQSATLEGRLEALSALDPTAALAFVSETASTEIDSPAPRSPLAEVLSEVLVRGAARDPKLATRVAKRFSAVWSTEAAAVAARSLVASGLLRDAEDVLASAVERNPNRAELIRERIAVALRMGEHERAHALLGRLFELDPSQATAAWIERTRKRLPPLELPEVRIALLSSYTVDSLAAFLDSEIRRMGLRPLTYIAPFNSWMLDVLDAASGLREFGPEILFLSVSIDDLAPRLAGHPSEAELQEIGAQAVDRVAEAVGALRAWSQAPLVVHSFHSAFESALGVLEGGTTGSRGAWLEELNRALRIRIEDRPRTFVLDMARAILARRGGISDDPKLRHLASMRLSESVTAEVARRYARFVAPLKGLTRKCIVLDLDNTLWGGVVGEEGPNGIRLNPVGTGSEYHEFQQYLHSLSRLGFLLAICSKNNLEDALPVLRDHPDMVLRPDDFSAMRINWEPKPDNLRSIAEELSIGVDSLVFVDDNPNERERVRRELPGVLVPELPADATQFRRVLEALPELQRLSVTTEDLERVASYKSQKERATARVAADSSEQYLASLAIRVEAGLAREAEIERIQQLFSKTNQFNTTTRRYSLAEVREHASNPQRRLYAAHAEDRFGKHGLIAAALVRTDGAWVIDSFLMSCRVIGYGVETSLLSLITADARAAGVRELRAEWIETSKNVPARDLLPKHGFSVVGSANGATLLSIDLASAAIENPGWVELTRRA